MKKIHVCAKVDAEESRGSPDWIVISIRDPGAAPAKLQSGWKAVLQLEFHDKEDRQLALKTGLWRLFDDSQARQCLQFVEEHRASASGLLVHCIAGASRSPAVARGISAHLGMHASSDWPRGNELVLETMMREAERHGVCAA